MSSEQKQLFSLLCDFTTETVMSLVSLAYSKYGAATFQDKVLREIIPKFSEQYFNQIAWAIYDKSDSYVNTKFAEMTSIKLENENNPIDLLNNIAIMMMYVLGNLEIKNPYAGDVMSEVKSCVRKIISGKTDLIAGLTGCTPDHEHVPIRRGERVFTFTAQKAK